MRDIKSFCKLFDLNVPSYDDFEYYKNLYSKLPKWSNINNLVKLYEEAEDKIDDIYDFKIKKSNEVIEFLKTTRAYNDLNDDNLIPDLPTDKNYEYKEGLVYLSLDIKKANWEVFKKYDPDFVNQLGDTYSDLLNKFDIPEIFHHSKHLRQYIFGNLNPKRQVKAQRVMVQDVINGLSNYELNIECIKTDEVIFSIDDFKKASEIVKAFNSSIFRCKLFTIKRVENFRINTYIDIDGGNLWSEPVGCNGSKYFIFLKKYILNEPLDVRDLYFRIDGDLAIWNVENLKINL